MNHTDVTYAVFKNGKQYKTGVLRGPKFNTQIHSGAGPGEYSLRLYCNLPTNQKTNCSASGYIQATK